MINYNPQQPLPPGHLAYPTNPQITGGYSAVQTGDNIEVVVTPRNNNQEVEQQAVVLIPSANNIREEEEEENDDLGPVPIEDFRLTMFFQILLLVVYIIGLAGKEKGWQRFKGEVEYWELS